MLFLLTLILLYPNESYYFGIIGWIEKDAYLYIYAFFNILKFFRRSDIFGIKVARDISVFFVQAMYILNKSYFIKGGKK